MNYSQKVYENIKKDYPLFLNELTRETPLQSVPKTVFIPLSALKGDNVVKKNERMSRHKGKPLLEILNEIGLFGINFSSSIAYNIYGKNRQTGSFIMIDRITNNTVGAGMIQAKKESRHVVWHEHKVSRENRIKIKGHKPCLIWLTGLSGAGKSTIANGVEEALNKMIVHTYLLDGDNIRHGLNNGLGFSPKDRKKNIRGIAEVAKLFVNAGLVVITSFISPFKEDREFARSLLSEGEFIEVFVDAPLNVCEKRDTKGFYEKARKGEIKEFTGISSPYESPDVPEIHIRTDELTVRESVEKIINHLKNKGIINYGL